MDSDLECLHKVGKKSSTSEEIKVEKNFQPKSIGKLKNRFDFLNVRKNGKKIIGKYVIINFSKNNLDKIRFGITVSKKIGNAVLRNYIKRIFRDILRTNFKKIDFFCDIEIIPKKNINKVSFGNIKIDICKILDNMKF